MIKTLLIISTLLTLTACDQADETAIATDDLTLPPLTYIHKFQNCPFEVKFPGEPETYPETMKVDQKGYITENYILYADCYFIPKMDELQFDNKQKAQMFLDDINLDNNQKIFNRAVGYELGEFELLLNESAELKYQVIVVGDPPLYSSGVIFIKDNYVALLNTVSLDQFIAPELISEFYESFQLQPHESN